MAWLDVPECRLAALPRRCELRGDARVRYGSPTARSAGVLALPPSGFVRRYPGLWEEEA